MASQSGSSDSKELELEWRGPIPIEDVQQLLDKLGVETVESISIEVAIDQKHNSPVQILPIEKTDIIEDSTASKDQRNNPENLKKKMDLIATRSPI